MSTPSRKATRTALALALPAALPSAAAIYGYQAKDFGGQSPVVVVTSAGSERERVTLQGSIATFLLYLHLFVAFAADGESGYTDATTEDLLDQVEDEIAQFVDTQQQTASWHALAYDRVSDAGEPAMVGGVEYRHELIVLAVHVRS